MALPSPVADFPDMRGTISSAQARARELMAAAWAGMGKIGQGSRPLVSTAMQTPSAGHLGIATYGENGGQKPQATRGALAQGIGAWSGTSGGGLEGRELLARTIQGEAGGEGFEGMLAVGSVIGNRVRSGRYGGYSLEDVIMAPGQFSMWNGVTGYAGGEGAIDPSSIRVTPEAYRAADAVLSGGYVDPTSGATHYYNPSVANPAWGQARAGGDWRTLGNHIFGWADGRPGAHPQAKG
jgi:hypothetical protein